MHKSNESCNIRNLCFKRIGKSGAGDQKHRQNTNKRKFKNKTQIYKKVDKFQINITYIKYACPEQKPAGVNDVQSFFYELSSINS